jgi:hypothetical protein
MSIQLNDRVKFLDEEGGGIVTKIIDHAMVEVTTPDGFSFPYLVKNLVKPVEDSHSAKMFTQNMPDMEIPVQEVSTSLDTSSFAQESPLRLDRHGIKEELEATFLAFVPREQYRLVFGSLDVFLVNASSKTNWFVLYQQADQGYKQVFAGQIKAFHKMHLKEIDREELNQWEKVVVQMVVLEVESSKLSGPIDLKLNVRANRFFNEKSYIKSDFLQDKAILLEIARLKSIPVLHELNQVEEKGQEEHVERKQAQQKENKEILKHKTSNGKAVVDMHIWKLTDDELSLSAHEKLMLQMDYFHKCLESAQEHHFREVVFIHGVGSGRLKEEVQLFLDEKEIRHKPAPMAEYGIGALIVEL